MPLGFRWLIRKIGLSSVKEQDVTALVSFFKKNKVDAVLAEYGGTSVSVMDACRSAQVPLIAHFHGYDAYRKSVLESNEKDYKRLFSQAAAIIAVSKDMRDHLISLGSPPEKTFHNACGAELPPDLRAQPAVTGVKFLMVGRLVEKKAPFISILAFSQVVSACPDATLEVIGGGHLEQACKQLCRALKLEKNVIFRGERSHAEVLHTMTQSRCFVQHSVMAPDGDKEGTPVGVLEAMGLGLPVVSTLHGGIIDVIENGVTGSLVEEFNVDEMSKAMLKYANDASLANLIGENARKSVLANNTSEKSIGRLWNIIQNAVAS